MTLGFEPRGAEGARAIVFMDRDGVLIENRADYVKSWDEVRFLEGAFTAIQRLNEAEFAVVIATNQSVVGRGLVALDEAIRLNDRFLSEFSSRGLHIDGLVMCPHSPEAGCSCRKPASGMLTLAAKELGTELDGSYMVGDAVSDVSAAVAVGAKPILVRTGRGVDEETKLADESFRCPVVDTVHDAVTLIVTDGVQP